MLKWTLLLSFPVLELYLMVLLGSSIGGVGVVLLVIFSALFGIGLLKRQAQHAAAFLQTGCLADHDAKNILQDRLILFIAAVLFIFPGFLSDLIGTLLLIPTFRKFLGKYLLNFMKKQPNNVSRFFFTKNGQAFYSVYDQHCFFKAEPEKTQKSETVIYDCTPSPSDSSGDK